MNTRMLLQHVALAMWIGLAGCGSAPEDAEDAESSSDAEGWFA